MSQFEWDDSLNVGVDRMNEQHQQIIHLINVVADDVENNENPLGSFDKLANYVVRHFQEEEKYMESHNYSSLSSHKIIHKQLLARVGQFRDSMVAGDLNTEDLFAFLRMWLKSHIKGIDQRYGIECANFQP
ncbi:bacteriohemerythrin [Mangrovimicrobium sediminis]|uniref:Bacteriohemerythrin n=1 Tax=Mangrovimicrobium sediminis TaxID=2562682 RepID=A0A4Z0M7J6_9GAMM|nr:bacteriohemerythrin [Haliea sp. SAOS-164]TGD75464.1 bacteriohemerythrin [Haliea sp. SAOS-164]